MNIHAVDTPHARLQARHIIWEATTAAVTVSSSVLEQRVARGVSHTNELSDTVVSALGQIRDSIPTTRDVDVATAAEAREALGRADSIYDRLERSPEWAGPHQRQMLGAAARTLDAAELLLMLSVEGRSREADLAYEEVFLHYESFRQEAEALARFAAANPTVVWDHTRPDLGHGDGALIDDIRARRAGARGRELRAALRYVEGAGACVRALEQPSPRRGLPEACELATRPVDAESNPR